MPQSPMTGYLSRSKRKRARIKKLLNITKKVAGYRLRCKVSATHEMCVVLTFFYALFSPSTYKNPILFLGACQRSMRSAMEKQYKGI